MNWRAHRLLEWNEPISETRVNDKYATCPKRIASKTIIATASLMTLLIVTTHTLTIRKAQIWKIELTLLFIRLFKRSKLDIFKFLSATSFISFSFSLSILILKIKRAQLNIVKFKYIEVYQSYYVFSLRILSSFHVQCYPTVHECNYLLENNASFVEWGKNCNNVFLDSYQNCDIQYFVYQFKNLKHLLLLIRTILCVLHILNVS